MIVTAINAVFLKSCWEKKKMRGTNCLIYPDGLCSSVQRSLQAALMDFWDEWKPVIPRMRWTCSRKDFVSLSVPKRYRHFKMHVFKHLFLCAFPIMHMKRKRFYSWIEWIQETKLTIATAYCFLGRLHLCIHVMLLLIVAGLLSKLSDYKEWERTSLVWVQARTLVPLCIAHQNNTVHKIIVWGGHWMAHSVILSHP